MAIIKVGGIISGLSGKIGGQTISNRAQNIVIRNIVQTNKTATIKQSVQRFLTGRISGRFKYLTQPQQDSWNDTAPNYVWTNSLGQEIVRNGYGAYNYCNQNLVLLGLPQRNTAGLFAPVAVPDVLQISRDFKELKIKVLNPDPDCLYVLFAQPNISQGATGQRGRMRYCGQITYEDISVGVDLIPLIETVFLSLPFPNNIGYRIEAINVNCGNRSPGIYIETVNVIPDADIIYDPDYQAVLDYALANGIDTPTLPVQLLQNQLMIDIKNAVGLDAFDILYVPAQDAGPGFAKINWGTDKSLSAVGVKSFQTNAGFYYSPGFSAPMSTNYSMLLNSVNATPSSFSLGVYFLGPGTIQGSNNRTVFLTNDIPRLWLRNGATSPVWMNSNNVTNLNPSGTAGSLGQSNQFSIFNRSSLTEVNLYRNNVQYPSVLQNGQPFDDRILMFMPGEQTDFLYTSYFHFARSFTTLESNGLENAIRNYIAGL